MGRRQPIVSWMLALLLPACAVQQEFLDVPNQHRGLRVDGEQQGVWTYFHGDGSLRSQGEYLDDEQHGRWEYRHAPGPDGGTPVEWEIGFDEGHLDGAYRRLYRGGQPVLEGAFDQDREEGPWAFYAPGGQLLQAGAFEDGLRTLRWAWFGNDGTILAEGYFHQDRQVGPWTWYAADGSAVRRARPMPRDVRLVRDLWEGGGVRREGFLFEDEPHGLWVSWHRSGRQRVIARYDEGDPVGEWLVLDPKGGLLAHGPVNDQGPTGTWTLVQDGAPESVPAEALPRPVAAPAGGALDAVLTQGAGLATAAWLGEMLLGPREPADWPSSEGGPVPTDLADVGGKRPPIPVPPQPWRAKEVDNLPAMLKLYTTGSSGGGNRRRGGSDPYSGRTTASSTGDASLSSPLVGKPLPVQKLVTLDGEIDVESLRGRKIALVVMRGFDGEICVYCAAQTRALELNRHRFEEAGAEVVVVYPGDGDDLDTFLAAVRTLSDEGEDPSYAMAFDPAFELVRALDIEAKKAMPTTLLLDEQGIVRWAYVGKDKVDRPPVDRLVGLLKDLPGR